MTRIAVRRHPERGIYEREEIDAILDEAVFCHIGFVVDGQPFVIPTIHARVDDTLYLHGSPASRMLRELAGGVDVCVTATLLDGVVLARSVYKSSLNYRSAVVLGRARKVDDEEEKRLALEAVVEHVAPGRSQEARAPNVEELKATLVLALQIDEASAKMRSGPPKDFEHDLDLRIWAGVINLRQVAGEPETAERVPEDIAVPAYVGDYRRPSPNGAGSRAPGVNEGELSRALVEASAAGGERGVRAVHAAAAIRAFRDYRWVGIYEVRRDEITVLGWDGPGPPAHTRFPRAAGLCGAAVATRRTVIVGDVGADPRYLTTQTTTRSEIVVPVFAAGAPVGLIDVESEQPNAFTSADQQLLERCAALISPMWRSERTADDVDDTVEAAR